MRHLRFAFANAGIAGALFLGMLGLIEVGRRLGVQQAAAHGPGARAGVGVVDGAVFALLALLLSFSFSGAATRFDHRRTLIANEATAIGSAWRLLDLLPPDSQAVARAACRRYVDEVIGWYSGATVTDALVEPPEVARERSAVWSAAVAAGLAADGDSSRPLLLPALNAMFAAVETERLARRVHPPLMIFGMLALTALASALFAGYGMANGATRNWIYIAGVAGTISVVVYVIIDLEYPRRGLIRTTAMDRALADLRAMMR